MIHNNIHLITLDSPQPSTVQNRALKHHSFILSFLAVEDQCDTVETESGICYWKSADAATWVDAEMRCEEKGGMLAAIETQEQADFIING